MKLNISKGNSKIGATPNVSLPPILTCQSVLPCREKCYAARIYKRLSSVRDLWNENWDLWRWDNVEYEEQLIAFLEKKQPARFRYHVGGDIPDDDYIQMMRYIALRFPQTVFMTYTRNWKAFIGENPENLIIWRSFWIGEQPSTSYPRIARVIPVGYTPKAGHVCPGNCTDCGFKCWHPVGEVLVNFHLH